MLSEACRRSTRLFALLHVVSPGTCASTTCNVHHNRARWRREACGAAREGLGVRGAMADLFVRRDRVMLEGRGSLAVDLGPRAL